MQKQSINILHIDNNHPVLMKELKNSGFTNHEDFICSKAEIAEKIQNYQGIVIRSRFKIDKNFIDKAVNLQFIARVGAGLESIDCEYAKSKNISLIAAPEGNRNAVGEHTLAMLLSLFNKINKASAEVKLGKWSRENNRGHELEGKTVGIIGYGNMGKSFAKKLRGFDVAVLCYDILENFGDENAKQVGLVEFQEKCDVVSLHTPWNESTDKLIDEAFINGFSKPFWFLNTARGNNVVTDDLVAALISKKILGAGLDVLEYEKGSFEQLFLNTETPAAFQYLLTADNVILTPHVAGWTFESHERLAKVIVEKIKEKYSLSEKDIEIENTETTSEGGVTGIGGFFFKSANPKELINWYKKHLGLKTDDYGSTFWWKDKNGSDCCTQWSPFSVKTTYFEPSQKDFMQNFRVQNLENLLAQLKTENVNIIGEMQTFDYGKFAWILDLEGNKIELWEPIDSVFL